MPQKKPSKKKYESGGFDLGKFFSGKDPQQLPAYKAAAAKFKAKTEAKKRAHKPIAQIQEEGAKRYEDLGDTTAYTRARQVKAAEKRISERAAKAKKPVAKKSEAEKVVAKKVVAKKSEAEKAQKRFRQPSDPADKGPTHKQRIVNIAVKERTHSLKQDICIIGKMARRWRQ